MTDKRQHKPITADMIDLAKLLGPPPLLSTEDADAFDGLLAQMLLCLEPTNFLEKVLVREFTECVWEMMRYKRHKTLAFELKLRPIRDFQAKRAKAAAQNRDPQGHSPAQNDGKPATEVGRMLELEDVVDSSIHDVDEILNRPPVDLDQARAFEATIVYQEQLDQLLNTAFVRRDGVLQLRDRYRNGPVKRPRPRKDPYGLASYEAFDAEGITEAIFADPHGPSTSKANDLQEEDRGQSDQC